ncbi:alkylation response protein AidB-like acyl-CoA dehydrogenase [Rhodoligotrophos appendicifer]|uniref:acyl-CoA dehydrogenase n=1 Tax=Rhodoligotrophos appendicifer TaxID=987056 RepID=UPI0011856AD1|nr:acyl-CoA dehydrogenase [Rhodoligotrophos appendicifer]
MPYTPQVDDLKHVLGSITGFRQLVEEGLFPDLTADTLDQILEEAGRFAGEVLAPLNVVGDRVGAKRNADGSVTTAPGWREAYTRWVEAGWGALPSPVDYGGQGLPVSVGLAVQELWNTAAMAFGLGPLLTQGAADALHQHGSEALKSIYLPKLATGEWSGTMVLTEPQAGTDLAAIKTKAEPQGDGTYRVQGTKIFITYGEHDLVDNIVHFVLARVVGAPEGTRGISMFLVPKVLVNEDGSLGARNDVKCLALEHKLGIHASPTCVMAYGEEDGAVGYLVGQENRGLNCMFTMMNSARLHVGMQGVAVGERAFQHALGYAQDRKQGKRSGSDQMVPIITHPDVKRMLLDMKAKVAASRAICFATAYALDVARHGRTEEERLHHEMLAQLLTPVAKAFPTDMGVDVASTGIQVHGGMGFIEETGAAQYYRDARIAPIYEGTNGVQAIDLVGRKLPLGEGRVVAGLIKELRGIAEEARAVNDPAFGKTAERVGEAVADLEEATAWMLKALARNQDEAMAGATRYLKLFGLAAGGAWLTKGALQDRTNGHVPTARFFAEQALPETGALKRSVMEGADAVLEAAL